ncbi:hypothetical protein BKA70DRAFT_1571662 [Coprinopsis sp. MPI-PUGE-AT-0042]|nr:hypothetical protein BKA70DRAFT_1571662 [Coprinopsis sp. MPI-PUGE-AT-0042]
MNPQAQGTSLPDDLVAAFSGDFKFQGNFYHSSTHPDAPNPRLHVDGVGTVAPSGKGDQTVVDTAVRNTWEIEPSKITFKNPKWTAWLEGVVFDSVWKGLGVAPFRTKPRCDLYKMLLYEQGSHFLPHQDTQKALGMFATVVVVLPTEYEGGELHLSHSGISQTLDLAKSADVENSVVAWYTDVIHEIKPVKSGYRLALSYNLIHTSPNVPRPTLPDMSSGVQRLRQVLERWAGGQYPLACFPSNTAPFFTYILDHKYSEDDLDSGAQALKGADAHRVSHLLPIAVDLGVTVGLANFSYSVVGYADDSGQYTKRRRYNNWNYSSDEEKEAPPMGAIEEEMYSLTHMVDMDGEQLLCGSYEDITKEVLLPKNAFKNVSPDKTEYEGYMGNGAGTLEQWYHRTVLMLYLEEDEALVDFELRGGMRKGTEKLKAATTVNKALAEEMIGMLQTASDPGHPYAPDAHAVKDAFHALFDACTLWGDHDLWMDAMIRASCSYSTMGKDRLTRALTRFSFASIERGLDALIQSGVKFKDRFAVAQAVSARYVSEEAAMTWTRSQCNYSLAAYAEGSLDDVPLLMAIFKFIGISALEKSIIPNVQGKADTYSFLVGLAEALHCNREALPGTSATTVDDLVVKCLVAAAPQWSSPTPVSIPVGGNPVLVESEAKVARIITIINLSLKTNDVTPCTAILSDILKATGLSGLPETFRDIYIPLIIQLKPLLSGFEMRLSSAPFGNGIRGIVQLYLANFATKEPTFQGPRLIAKLGCGNPTCHECQQLDAFMTGEFAQWQLHALQATRNHIERQLWGVEGKMCTYETIKKGSPHILVVTKTPALIELVKKELRVTDPKAFLAVVGKEELKLMFGEQGYQQIKTSVSGR